MSETQQLATDNLLTAADRPREQGPGPPARRRLPPRRAARRARTASPDRRKRRDSTRSRDLPRVFAPPRRTAQPRRSHQRRHHRPSTERLSVFRPSCDPRPIREVIPEVPEWLCRVVAKLHAKDPTDRFQTAREVADVLADCETQLRAHGKLMDYSRIPGGGRPARPRPPPAVPGPGARRPSR